MNYKYTYFSKLYDENYRNMTFDKTIKLRTTRFKKIAQFIKKGDSVLDFGGGDGELSRYLPNCSYAILDLSNEHKIDTFKRISLKKDIYIDASNNTYDVVVMSEVLEHIPNGYETLCEVNRVLKKNGRLIISVPNPFSLNFIIKAFFGMHLDPSREHLYWFDWSYLSNITTAVGFALQYKTTFSFIMARFYEKLYFIDPLIMKFFRHNGIQLLCVFKKVKSAPLQYK